MAKMKKKSDKKFIQSAIKNPGSLTAAAKRNNRSVEQEAQVEKASGTTKQKQRANFYLKVLKPAAKARKKASSLIK